MKKTLLKATLAVLLFTGAVSAQNIFDLHAQHFSNSLDGDGVGAKYDLPKVYVSTALKYLNGTYTRAIYGGSARQQSMSVEIKTPPANWSVSFDMSYYLMFVPHIIRFTSDTGKSITVSFKWNEIYLNGVKIYTNYNALEYRAAITGTISKSGNTVTCTIAGYVTKTITVSNFSKLKFVNVLITSESDGVSHSGDDILNGLNIGSN